MNALSTLRWLEQHGAQLLLQEIPPSRRQKNRIILQFRDPAGGLQSVGGYSIEHAVSRAQLRCRPLDEQLTPPNKFKVQTLIRGCRQLGSEAKLADVIALTDIDESLYCKWMRGERVGLRTAAKCESIAQLEPIEFLKRLQEFRRARSYNCDSPVELQVLESRIVKTDG